MTPFVPRVLVTRLGPDGGRTRSLCASLREAGMDVVDAGARSAADALAAAVVRDEIDVIALSLGARDPVPACTLLRQALTAAGRPDVPVIATGTISGSQLPDLARVGVRRVFVPNAPDAEVVQFVLWLVQPKAFVAEVLAGAPA
jgi:methylmalonyl-CoA mutase cobalamin-binding domain/chain